MNQRIADAIRALPPWLQDSYILGWLLLILCLLSFICFIRPALWRYLRAHLPARALEELSHRRRLCLFFGTVRKRASLHRCGWYVVNRLLLIAFPVITALHALSCILQLTLSAPPATLRTADAALLSVLFFAVATLSLVAQPAATMERRARWGFHTPGNVIHALLWEFLILLLLFLWLYVAFFLVLL